MPVLQPLVSHRQRANPGAIHGTVFHLLFPQACRKRAWRRRQRCRCSEIPALVISTAAGIMVSRVSTD
ncbi:hypothetical protein, partial [Ralstonia pseudosolanacearum]|uniref:hypothetical protein n=1 Tax=Ralstonia pseudosolanacearum TaxID=1310165 RepID=UPI003D2FFB06